MNLDKVVKDVFKLLFVADTNIYLLFRGGGDLKELLDLVKSQMCKMKKKKGLTETNYHKSKTKIM